MKLLHREGFTNSFTEKVVVYEGGVLEYINDE
jgi:hypothetical protein